MSEVIGMLDQTRGPAGPAGPDQGHTDSRASAERLADLPAAAVMTTNVLVVASTDDVLVAWEFMTQAGIRHLPVVDDGHLVGLIDDRQLAREWTVGPLSRQRRLVGDVITDPPVRVRPYQTVGRVAEVLHRCGLDAVCVVADDGVLVGLITTADLVAALAGVRKRPSAGTSHTTPALFRLTPVPLPPR